MSLNSTRNHLLSQMPPEDRLALADHLELIDMPRHFVIAEMNLPIKHYYFIEDGIASMVAAYPDGKKAEIGLIGREGVTPIARLLSANTMPYDCMMQVAGRGARVGAAALEHIVAERPSLHLTLLRFVDTLTAQAAYTGLSNAVHSVSVRLARWILMCHDRVDGDEIALTHEYMAVMLGSRRSGVTDAMHVLEGEHYIYANRGLVIMRDRAALETFAGHAYGPAERPSKGAASQGASGSLGLIAV